MPTSNYAFPYPASTATPNVPVDIKALADAVDAAMDVIDDRLDVVEPRPRGLVAHGHRNTISNASTGAVVSVLSLSAFAVTTGRAYRLRVSTAPRSDVASDRVVTELRYTTDGSAPTVASPVMPGMQHFHTQSTEAAASSDSALMEGVYKPASSHNLRLLLTVWRATGSGNGRLYADSTALTEVAVEDIGLAVTNTGTAL